MKVACGKHFAVLLIFGVFLFKNVPEVRAFGPFDVKISASAPGPADWCYTKGQDCEDNQWEKDKWAEKYPKCVDPGTATSTQSPINIKTSGLEPVKTTLTFSNEYKEDKNGATVKNNNHTAQFFWDVSITKEMLVTIDYPGHNTQGTYKFHHGHFHWGTQDEENKGSEHQLDDKSYPLELHLVHYGKQYNDIEDVVKKDDSPHNALLVIGLFFDTTENVSNELIKPITEALKDIENGNTSTTLNKPFNVFKLLPENLSFYHYDGSLTTPNCLESVQWVVMKTPLKISKSQIGLFRKLKNVDKFISGNYRNALSKQDKQTVSFHEVTLGTPPPGSGAYKSTYFSSVALIASAGLILQFCGQFGFFFFK